MVEEESKEIQEEELTIDDVLYEHFSIQTDPGQSAMRLDKFLANRIERLSRSKLQNAAKAGCIKVNDKVVKSNYKIKPKDKIQVLMPRPQHQYVIHPEEMDLEIVYEDEELLVLNKQAGLVVHPGCGNYTGTLIHGLLHHFQQGPIEYQQGEDEPRPGLVHRIDKDTTGLMVVAKTEYAKSHLSRQFFERTTQRTYQAIVWGEIEEEEGRIEAHIGRHQRRRQMMDVYVDGEEGKHAVTHYRLLRNMGYVSLVECKLETGRTHQIRVHFKHLGHPLFNDQKYGGDRILKGTVYSKYKQFVHNCFKILPRQALHAKTLGFEHPGSGEFMSFDSPLASDMLEVIEKWDRYMGGSTKLNKHIVE